jgi:hypothetical protein
LQSRPIKQKGAGKEVKYIYTKHSDSEKLDLYVSEQIEKGEYTKVVKAKAVVKEIVEDEVIEVAEEVADEHTKQVETVNTVEKKEDKAKVINIIDDERVKRMEALANFKSVKNIDSADEREEESKADAF